jgi:hypothetical protein
MEFNDLTYGNPTVEDLVYIQGNGLTDDLFETLKSKLSYPKNDSELVKDELNEIVDALATMAQPENQNYLKRYKSYDRNLIQSLSAIFKQRNIDVEQLCKDVVMDMQNLIYKLKFYYQRPRPKQIAQYYKLKLFPYKSFSAHTPSFPCGHCVQAIVMLNVIGNKNPTEYPFCKELIEDIAYSRVYLGHHFPSDNDGAREIGKAILKHPEFAKKYGI